MSDDADAQIFQVLGRQARQDRVVDCVVPESILVLCEAEAPQPTPNVHDDALPPSRRMIVQAQQAVQADGSQPTARGRIPRQRRLAMVARRGATALI
jgi:hypothetical protein